MKKYLFLGAICTFILGTANAAIVTTGFQTAVTNITHQATFDTLSSGDDLAAYTEDGLFITVNDKHCCFNGSFYANGGYSSGTSQSDSLYQIGTTDLSLFVGLELSILDWGGNSSYSTLIWETYMSGALTDSGTLTTPTGTTILGFSDNSGFNELRIGMFAGTALNNPLYIDNIRIGNKVSSSIPEPTSLALLGLGLASFGFSRKKKKA